MAMNLTDDAEEYVEIHHGKLKLAFERKTDIATKYTFTLFFSKPFLTNFRLCCLEISSGFAVLHPKTIVFFEKKSAQSSITQKPLCFNLVIRKQLTITTKILCHLNQEPPVAEPGAKRTGREKRLHPLGW